MKTYNKIDSQIKYLYIMMYIKAEFEIGNREIRDCLVGNWA